MAISEDTAAIVAAQLTVAWATRIGPNPKPASPIDADILVIYERFKGAITEAPLRGGGPVKLGGL